MITPKENYFRVLRGEIPEYVPSILDPHEDFVGIDYYLKPTSVPKGFAFSPWGVRYVGARDLNNGGIPEPNFIILHDITKWRDVIKNPDISNIDFEAHYTPMWEHVDRSRMALRIEGGEYFQTLVSFMGFEDALIAMYEEPDEVYELFDYISQYNLAVMRERIKYMKPDIYMIIDDCAAAKAPFFSLDMYKQLVKPFHKRHADLAREHDLFIIKHDCGKSEMFIPDWMEMGVCAWNPAQIMNDLPTISKKYKGKLAIEGGWDMYAPVCAPDAPDDDLIAALDAYVDMLAPGGSFTFMVRPFPNPDGDPRIDHKNKLIKDYYFSNVRDYYKTH